MKFIKLNLFFILFVLVSCNQSFDGPYYSIAGFTQGTTYHMTYQSPTADTIDLTEEVNALLAEFDQSLSTYIDTSNISLINRNLTDQADEYLELVFDESKRINEISGGAFDITVGPLIDAWGFGPGRKMEISAEVIDSILQYVGMDKVRIENGKVIKEFPETRLDLNAIAQGFSVDVVAEYFDEKNIKNYMIEIGGELITKGLSPRNDKWKIGIDKPFFGNQMVGNDLQAIVKLSGQALASSGNYRKYYEVDGKKIVHTVDPKTGYTKMSNLLSVTIITDKCMMADGLSTSCMALGLEKAKEFISAQENVEALFIYTDEDGLFLEWMTDGMKEML
ncbi:MAG: FAD:protein FMN transferase [Bacteroidales bacterium]|jgi:thiamine biosynthesis lipoprotein|nr:FAD:protein FMN transferase [Bacteroidales bacterium]